MTYLQQRHIPQGMHVTPMSLYKKYVYLYQIARGIDRQALQFDTSVSVLLCNHCGAQWHDGEGFCLESGAFCLELAVLSLLLGVWSYC